jgi:hypothetical protein
MVLGYVAAAIIMLGLIGYLVLKARNLRGEIALLKALEVEQAAENEMDD